MANILSLYDKLNEMGVRFYHWSIGEEQATTIEIGESYGVFLDFGSIHSTAEELVLVAHEGGHICTGTTHTVYSPYDLIERHENRADRWAIQHLIPKDMLEAAVASGFTQPWELAEYFGVTEDFIRKAVCYYENGNLAADLYLVR